MKNLTTKLVKVMSEVKRVSKNGRNDFHNYDYVTEADILEAVRETLVKHNVFVFSSVDGSHKEADMTTVRVTHTIVDADSGESMSVSSIGQGQDKGDKGANKAVTAAMKYFLMKNLLIPTGDDSEATDADGKSTGSVKTKTTDSKPKKYGFSNKAPVAKVEGSDNEF